MTTSVEDFGAPKPKLRLAMIQSSLDWEEIDSNLKNFDQLLESLSSVDLVVLPEMFSTGFTMNPQAVAKRNNEEAVPWMKKWSQSLGCALCGSLCVEEKGQYFNRFFAFDSGELVAQYDKRHLFSLAGEEKVYQPGNQQVYWNFKGWKIMPLICYDLRFPAWSRNNGETDLYLYVANWPQRRIAAWDILLKARAHENMAYVVGVNRVGSDANDIAHNGSSQLIGITGEVLASAEDFEEKVLYAEIEHSLIKQKRDRFGFLNDRDAFTLQ